MNITYQTKIWCICSTL